MWGQIISAALGAAGSIFGGKQETTSSIDYVKLARSATKAGFNPLTALRAGGGNGFVTTTTGGSGATPLGMALSALGEEVGGLSTEEPKNPIQKASEKPSTALVDYQLRKATGPSAGRLYPPATTVGGKVVSSKGFIGPPTPRQYTKDNGGMDLYVPYFDRSQNKVLWGPNPDIPDLDQMLTPPSIAGTNKVAELAGSAVRKGSGWQWVNPFLPQKYFGRPRPLQSGGW